MIDMFSLLVSTLFTALVVLRAIRLDREIPWFERPRPVPTSAQRNVVARTDHTRVVTQDRQRGSRAGLAGARRR